MVEWLFLSWWGGQGADDEWSHSSDPTTSPGQPTASLQANGLHECWGKKLLMRIDRHQNTSWVYTLHMLIVVGT